jgi:RNA ligase
MKYTDIFSKELLERMIAEGLVRVQTHPVLPLRILNYSEITQFRGIWNECTLACRGLIIDHDDNVIARPFKKFFNMGESHAAHIDWDSRIVATNKADGSMGVWYKYGVHQAIATRGSFMSEQAQHATRLWNSKYRDRTYIPDFHTPIFEIIYPDNRIVLDYGDMDDLVLLGMVDMRYGIVYGPMETAAMIHWIGPETSVFDYKNIHECVAAPYRPNAEGMVIRSGNNMVKLKQADYIELHRLISMLSERSVWWSLKDGKTIEQICEALPDEFHGFVRDVGDKLLTEFGWLQVAIDRTYSNLIGSLPEGFSRKEFAFAANRIDHYRPHMFNMLDGKSTDELIWKQIKPEAKTEDGYPDASG